LIFWNKYRQDDDKDMACSYWISSITLLGILKQEMEIRSAYQSSSMSPSCKDIDHPITIMLSSPFLNGSKRLEPKTSLLVDRFLWQKKLGSSFVSSRGWIDSPDMGLFQRGFVGEVVPSILFGCLWPMFVMV